MAIKHELLPDTLKEFVIFIGYVYVYTCSYILLSLL